MYTRCRKIRDSEYFENNEMTCQGYPVLFQKLQLRQKYDKLQKHVFVTALRNVKEYVGQTMTSCASMKKKHPPESLNTEMN